MSAEAQVEALKNLIVAKEMEIQEKNAIIAQQSYAVAALKRIACCPDLFDVRESAAVLQLGQRDLIQKLLDRGWAYRSVYGKKLGRLLPNARHVERGLVVRKMETTVTLDGTEISRPRFMMTGRGLVAMAKLLNAKVDFSRRPNEGEPDDLDN